MKLGTTELIVILVIVLLIFGPTQIPKLTKMFGKSVKGFKDGMEETEEEAPAESGKAKKAKASKKAEKKADEDASDEEES
ncbi:MAG: twin-arginine translocase TatA/TatE family subunit [Oscillospiraceae bacterium]|nr:twin-arginine translocase TatA/TatE family subunit [Oscillospiraceae bacterium]